MSISPLQPHNERSCPRGTVHLSGALDGPASEALAALLEALTSHPAVHLEIDVTGPAFSDPRALMVLDEFSRQRGRPTVMVVRDEPVGIEREPRASRGPGGVLTAREAEVIGHIAGGLSNAGIGEKTYLSVNTVKSYIRSAYRKMGVSSRTQAVLWGIEHGLGSPAIQLKQTSPPENVMSRG